MRAGDPAARAPAPVDRREERAEALAARLDVPMAVLGVIFLLLVLAETVSHPTGAVGTAFTVAGWLIWAAFVAEFVARLWLAGNRGRFLRRHWWEVLFLAVPFLRFLRVARALRATRVGTIVTSAVRTGRSARQRLSGRLGWLAGITGIVVLSGSQIAFEVGHYPSYGDALHAVALATVGGQTLGQQAGAIRLLEVALILYSVIFFAALAGSVGAFLLEGREQEAAEKADDVLPPS